MSTATASPLSPKQAAFIDRLRAEREVPPVAAALLKFAEDRELTSREASSRDRLADGRTARNDLPQPANAEPGYYVTDAGEVLVVSPTRSARAPTPSGWSKPTRGGSKRRAEWVYAPGMGRTLAGIKPLTAEKAALLGHLHGYCVICGLALTDPKSVARGIGRSA